MYKQTHTPFQQQSRSKRKLKYIRLKNKLKKAFLKKGALFTTHDYIHEGTTWADIYFLSKKTLLFYNATIETANAAWHQQLDSKASDLALDQNDLPEFISHKITDLNLWLNNPYFTELSKKTKIIKQEIIDSKNFFTYEEYELLTDFSYGIGLNMIIDQPYLSQESINQAIIDFINKGETNWKSEKALQFNYEENASFSINSLILDEDDE